MKPLKIGEYKAKIPLIQGGMGVGISLSSLAGAVAKEGGIGVISTAQIGFSCSDYLSNPLEANLRMIGEHIKRAREIAPQGILGVNIMVATKEYGSYVKAAIENGIDMIISGAGLPLDLPELARGSKTKLVPIVSSIKAASVLCKMWDRKHHTAPDALIVEGPLAGGHLGFRKDEILHYTQELFDQQIKGIIQLANQYGKIYQKEIPVIAAGGIHHRSDTEHYLKLGANGVQIGSQFVTTKECDANERYKEAYVKCKKEDIVIVDSPVGMPGRAIANSFVKRMKTGRIPIEHCKGCIRSCRPSSSPYCIADALIRAVTGNVEEGLIFCGANAHMQTEITTVRDVIKNHFM